MTCETFSLNEFLVLKLHTYVACVTFWFKSLAHVWHVLNFGPYKYNVWVFSLVSVWHVGHFSPFEF